MPLKERDADGICRNGTGGIERSGQKAIDLGAFALKAGILHIDTAQIYGTEAETQGAIDKAGMKRGDVWVTSKSESNLMLPRAAGTSNDERYSRADTIVVSGGTSLA